MAPGLVTSHTRGAGAAEAGAEVVAETVLVPSARAEGRRSQRQAASAARRAGDQNLTGRKNGGLGMEKAAVFNGF